MVVGLSVSAESLYAVFDWIESEPSSVIVIPRIVTADADALGPLVNRPPSRAEHVCHAQHLSESRFNLLANGRHFLLHLVPRGHPSLSVLVARGRVVRIVESELNVGLVQRPVECLDALDEILV